VPRGGARGGATPARRRERACTAAWRVASSRIAEAGAAAKRTAATRNAEAGIFFTGAAVVQMELAIFGAATFAFALRARARASAAPPPKGAPAPALHLGKDFAEKRRRVVEGGVDNLHLIFDFDRTMTTYEGPRGGRGATCHHIVEARRPRSVRERAEALNGVFYPVEISARLSREFKLPVMEVWYALVNDLLVETGMTRADLEEDVREANVALRAGVAGALAWAARHDVPVTIFSAGIGDVLAECLRQLVGPLHPRVRVVSNEMRFDARGVLVGFAPRVITPFTKNARDAMGDAPFFGELCARRNVVLLGDGPGDATMADGLGCETVLRVGFLNDAGAALRQLAEFTAIFDAVITHDGPADPLLSTLLRDVEAASARAPAPAPVPAVGGAAAVAIAADAR